MNASRLVTGALAACVLGALLLKGFAGHRPSDQAASISNGAPQGLLALSLLLQAEGIAVSSINTFTTEHEKELGRASVLVIPPPERTAWTPNEVQHILDQVQNKALQVVVVCDADKKRRRRLRAWLDALQIDCHESGEANAKGHGTLPAYGASLWFRDGMRIEKEKGGGIPAFVDDNGGTMVLRRHRGAGMVTVIGSASLLQNDGLNRAENARFALSILSANHVTFEEAHHRRRGRAVLAETLWGRGPSTAVVALVLLLLMSLASLAPRPGEGPGVQEGASLGNSQAAAQNAVGALAALYLRAGVFEVDSSLTSTVQRRDSAER